MQSLSKFIRILGSIAELKKMYINQRLEKYYCTLGRIEQSEALVIKFGLFQIQLEGHGTARLHENFAILTLIEAWKQ